MPFWGYEMKKMVAGILRQYGNKMTLEHGGGAMTVKGFFQPVRSKSWQSLTNVATPLGEIPRGQYVYIGPADVTVALGDVLKIGDDSYVFRKVEPYWYGDDPIYIWGLCVEKGVNDTWGSQS